MLLSKLQSNSGETTYKIKKRLGSPLAATISFTMYSSGSAARLTACEKNSMQINRRNFIQSAVFGLAALAVGIKPAAAKPLKPSVNDNKAQAPARNYPDYQAEREAMNKELQELFKYHEEIFAAEQRGEWAPNNRAHLIHTL